MEQSIFDTNLFSRHLFSPSNLVSSKPMTSLPFLTQRSASPARDPAPPQLCLRDKDKTALGAPGLSEPARGQAVRGSPGRGPVTGMAPPRGKTTQSCAEPAGLGWAGLSQQAVALDF